MQAKAAAQRPEHSEEDEDEEEDEEEDVGTCCLTTHRPPHSPHKPIGPDVVSVPHATSWALTLSLASYQHLSANKCRDVSKLAVLLLASPGSTRVKAHGCCEYE